MNTRLTIIGGGNMGETMAASLIESKTLSARAITVVDLNANRLAQLQRRYKVQTEQEISRAVAKANIVILAVKPQHCQRVMELAGQHLSDSALVISIMAGVPLQALRSRLKHKRIIRAMPNTPAKIQEGITAWIATGQVTAAQKKAAKLIFSSFGKQLEVKKEDLIDVATAVSGSGPAYVFAFAEYMIEAGHKLGLTKEQSTLLVKQTVRGAALLLDESEDDAATLREKVTSKKGTTAAALKVFRSERLGARVGKGLRAAYKRAKDLSRLL